MASDTGLTRFRLDGTVAHRGGQQFVGGTGYGADAFEEVHRPESHGFASHPVKGGTGLLMQSRSNRDSAYMLGGENPALRPDLPEGAVALYDHLGNIIKLFGEGGGLLDFKGNPVSMKAGQWTIEGPVTMQAGGVSNGDLTINGNLTVIGKLKVVGTIELVGSMTATGTITDGDGDGGA